MFHSFLYSESSGEYVETLSTKAEERLRTDNFCSFEGYIALFIALTVHLEVLHFLLTEYLTSLL